jgi:choline dehydrogenase-like flavoprotein
LIIDAREVPENKDVKTDVCIVGGGVAGVILAREFIGQRFRVCLLESGGLKADQQTQALYRGENIGNPYSPLETARARYFGGSSNFWRIAVDDICLGARIRPLDKIDFEERDWVPHSGWPFNKSHLDPFYKRAESICKIEPHGYDVEDWEDPAKRPRLPFIGDQVKTAIFKFAYRDLFTRDYPQEIARAVNITTYLYANVVEIKADKTLTTVSRLRVACLEGNRFWVSAKLFILAAGGIETPRLLLISNKKQKAGLGNQNDLVGKFFMEHPHFRLDSDIYVPAAPGIFKLTALYDNVTTVNGVPILGKLSLSDEVLCREKLLNYVVQLYPRIEYYSSLSRFLYPTVVSESVDSFRTLRSSVYRGHLPKDLGKHLKSLITGIDEISVATYRSIRRWFTKTFNRKKIKQYSLIIMSEQAPNPLSRVTLSSERDSLGQNLVRLDWRLSPIDIQSVVRSQKILDEELRLAGLGRLHFNLHDDTPPQRVMGGYHHMGTTRMHVDPKKGVVDQDCKVHDIHNLFIAGPSVFPTVGYANPVLTIVALAVRLADHVKKIMGSNNMG